MTDSAPTIDASGHRTTTLVDAIDDITPDWLTGALRQSGVLDEGTVTGLTSEVMSVGQLGLVARLNLTYDRAAPAAPPTVMVKLPSSDAGSRSAGITLGIYEAEVRFYQCIAPTRHPSAAAVLGGHRTVDRPLHPSPRGPERDGRTR